MATIEEFMKTTKEAGHTAELQRLTDQHAIVTDALNGLLVAPVDFFKPGLKILDSATADGHWLKELQASSPAKHEYVGTDIEPELFPSNPPPNTTFVKQSITEPWPSSWNESFDLIHQRFGIAGVGQTPVSTVVEQFAGLCKSGGWIELVELNSQPPNLDNGPAWSTVMKMMHEVFSAIGIGGYALKLKSDLEAAGMVDVEERRIICKLGAAAKPSLSQKGINSATGAIKPLTAAANSMPVSLKPEELDGLEDRVREELQNRGGAYELVVVYGRKP